MRYRFIGEQHDWHSVKMLCRVMKVSRGGYYDWLKRQPCARQREDQRLLKQIEKLHHDFREAYGAIRLSNELEKLGERCSRHRVARLKRAKGLWTKRRRRFVLTTKADPGAFDIQSYWHRGSPENCQEHGVVVTLASLLLLSVGR